MTEHRLIIFTGRDRHFHVVWEIHSALYSVALGVKTLTLMNE